MVVKCMQAGVPQGSVLGLTLWNIAFNRIVRGGNQGANCRTICYVDDTLVLVVGFSLESATLHANQKTYETIRRSQALGLEVATEKTEIVLFDGRRNLPRDFTIQVGRDVI